MLVRCSDRLGMAESREVEILGDPSERHYSHSHKPDEAGDKHSSLSPTADNSPGSRLGERSISSSLSPSSGEVPPGSNILGCGQTSEFLRQFTNGKSRTKNEVKEVPFSTKHAKSRPSFS